VRVAQGLHRPVVRIEVITMDASALRSGPSAVPVAWAIGVLRAHEMPSEEIRAVLTTDDPELVHRYLELHGERLDEWLVDQRRTLTALERVLAESADARRSRPCAASPALPR
jgi:hypothetical protein